MRGTQRSSSGRKSTSAADWKGVELGSSIRLLQRDDVDGKWLPD